MQQTAMQTYEVWDRNRERCPVTRDGRLGWVVTRHTDIRAALERHRLFSNRVSRHLSVPNGMDPPEHTAYRRIVECYFTPERMQAFEPVCRGMARELVGKALAGAPVIDVQASLGLPYAARVQCGFLGWPASMTQALLDWATANLRAIRDLDRIALADNARRFERLIGEQLQVRRNATAAADHDLTASLMREQVNGRGLDDAEIVSILRNWTAGEVGTISASVGILASFIATHPGLQHTLRQDASRIPYAIEEILRIHGPLLTNRRTTTCPVQVGGTEIPEGAPVTIHWPAGNRDPRVFADPLAFRWDRDQRANLLFGAGIHVCPGAPLARMELRLIVEALLEQTMHMADVPDDPPVPADPPLGGFARVMVALQRKSP